MRFIKQPDPISVTNLDGESKCGEGENQRHGPLLPNSIRSLVCGPSGCGKTNVVINLLQSPNGLCFENVYIYSKSLHQPKYRY